PTPASKNFPGTYQGFCPSRYHSGILYFRTTINEILPFVSFFHFNRSCKVYGIGRSGEIPFFDFVSCGSGKGFLATARVQAFGRNGKKNQPGSHRFPSVGACSLRSLISRSRRCKSVSSDGEEKDD